MFSRVISLHKAQRESVTSNEVRHNEVSVAAGLVGLPRSG